MKALVIHVGQRFGRLSVVDPDAGRARDARRLVGVRCDCGTSRVVRLGDLVSGNTSSCGCLETESKRTRCVKHGACRPTNKQFQLYQLWIGMKQRTTNPDNISYPNYGGRGIKVCSRWSESFDAFLADMGPRPGRGYSIERIDNDGDYCPENCRWATRIEQNRNSRHNHVVQFRGEEVPLSVACERAGMNYDVVKYRIRAGWPVERALTELSRKDRC